MSIYYNYNFISRSVNEVISDLASLNVSLTLWRNYKGILFSLDVKILEVYPYYSIFGVPFVDHLSCVDKTVYLQSSWLELPLSATVVGQNPIRSRLILNHFYYCNHEWVNRVGQRVHPDRPIYAVIGHDGQCVTTKLIDLHSNGMAFIGNTKSLVQARVRPGADIFTSFQLTPELSLKKVSVKVENSSAFSPTMSRIGTSINAGIVLTQTLQKYVTRRREEILSELSPIYNRLEASREKETSLFFVLKKPQDIRVESEPK